MALRPACLFKEGKNSFGLQALSQGKLGQMASGEEQTGLQGRLVEQGTGTFCVFLLGRSSEVETEGLVGLTNSFVKPELTKFTYALSSIPTCIANLYTKL